VLNGSEEALPPELTGQNAAPPAPAAK